MEEIQYAQSKKQSFKTNMKKCLNITFCTSHQLLKAVKREPSKIYHFTVHTIFQAKRLNI